MGGKDSTGTPRPRRETPTQRGVAAESVAADWLQAQGLRIVARNVRYRGGEIDLICRDRGALVFVEVRQRSDGRFGGAAESITAAKIARIVLAARLYLAANPALASLPARFDCVLLGAGDRVERWIRDAFPAC
jgi:putative endonuclease